MIPVGMRRLDKEVLWTKIQPPPTPPNSYVEALTPVPQNVTVFGDMVFKKVIMVKWGNIGRP